MQKMVTQQPSTFIDAHENCQIIAGSRLSTTFRLIEKERSTTGHTACSSVYSQVDLLSVDTFLFFFPVAMDLSNICLTGGAHWPFRGQFHCLYFIVYRLRAAGAGSRSEK